MAEQIFATKGNLINLKKSLQLSKTGFELLDRKNNILIRETMSLIDVASEIQKKIDITYDKAYDALQEANITLGVVDDMANSIPVENGLSLSARSVMGVEIPIVRLEESEPRNYYGYSSTNSRLDEAYKLFAQVKRLTAELAQIENSVYRLAAGIKKTQKRANSLKNIVIPRFESQIRTITEALEEKEREEFSRMKVIKKTVK